MNLTKKALGLTLAASVGFAAITFADDPGVSSKKSLESRIQELEAKLKDLGGNTGGGVKGSGIKISGFVDTSYVVNLGDTDNFGPIAGGAGDRAGGGAAPPNAGRVFDSQFDSFNLNAVKLTIQKDKDTSKFPAGFRLDTIFGEDARVIKGGSNIGGSTADDSEFAIEQAYINLGVPIGNGIDVKFGKMVTLLGFEVLESPANWQFSRSDAFRLAPMTQTGATFGYQWNDMFTTTVGLINGWDSTTSGSGTAGGGGGVFGSGNRNLNPGFVGRVDVSGPKTSVGDFNAFVAGFYANDVKVPTASTTAAGIAALATSNDEATHIWNIGGTWNKPFEVEQMTWGVDYLYRNDEQPVTPAPLAHGEVDASAFSSYAKWDWNKYLTSSARLSYSWYNNNILRNATGAPVSANSLSPLVVSATNASFNPAESDLFSLTLTQAFNVWKDTLLRLEWRHDWTDAANIGFGVGSAVANSRDDIRQEQDTIAVNVVYSF
ncbi:MAG: outer membrane beta-barrel protein [Verrucomicrobia bacterium]|nr:outer membrane beta-barrel protein [Verrucomicrobiota bacterium]